MTATLAVVGPWHLTLKLPVRVQSLVASLWHILRAMLHRWSQLLAQSPQQQLTVQLLTARMLKGTVIPPRPLAPYRVLTSTQCRSLGSATLAMWELLLTVTLVTRAAFLWTAIEAVSEPITPRVQGLPQNILPLIRSLPLTHRALLNMPRLTRATPPFKAMLANLRYT